MASIYRKKYTRPIPEGAQVLQRDGKKWVRWTDGNGEMRTAPVTPCGTPSGPTLARTASRTALPKPPCATPPSTSP